MNDNTPRLPQFDIASQIVIELNTIDAKVSTFLPHSTQTQLKLVTIGHCMYLAGRLPYRKQLKYGNCVHPCCKRKGPHYLARWTDSCCCYHDSDVVQWRWSIRTGYADWKVWYGTLDIHEV
jgi:hypothetical protein